MEEMDISDWLCVDVWDEPGEEEPKEKDPNAASKGEKVTKAPGKKKSMSNEPSKRSSSAKKPTVSESSSEKRKHLSVGEKKVAKKISTSQKQNGAGDRRKSDPIPKKTKPRSNNQEVRDASPISDDEFYSPTKSKSSDRNVPAKKKDNSVELLLKRKQLINDLMEEEQWANEHSVAKSVKPKILPCDSSSDVAVQKNKRARICHVDKEGFTKFDDVDLHEECSCNINLYSENLADLRITCLNPSFDPKKKVHVKQIKVSDLIVARTLNEGVKPLFESGVFKSISGCQCPVHSSKRIVTVVESSNHRTKATHHPETKAPLSERKEGQSHAYNHKFSSKHHGEITSSKRKKSDLTKHGKNNDANEADRGSDRGHRRNYSKRESVGRHRSDRSSSIEIIDERIHNFSSVNKTDKEGDFSKIESQDSGCGGSGNRLRNSPMLEEGEIDDSAELETSNHTGEQLRKDFLQKKSENFKSGSSAPSHGNRSFHPSYRTRPNYPKSSPYNYSPRPKFLKPRFPNHQLS